MPACGAVTAAVAGITAATSLAKGVYSMTASSDNRPKLGGPDSMTGSAAADLGQAYSSANAPTKERTQLLSKIEQNMGIIGSRLAPSQPRFPAPGGALPAPIPAPPSNLRRV